MNDASVIDVLVSIVDRVGGAIPGHYVGRDETEEEALGKLLFSVICCDLAFLGQLEQRLAIWREHKEAGKDE